MQAIVDAGWLARHRDEVVVADVRWYLDGRSGASAFAAGHLEGAVYVDLPGCLAAPPSPAAGRHPLPDPAVFAACMGAVGIGDGTPVVAYDDARGSVAARLVWMLRAVGEEAALLDGGLEAWPGPLATGAGASVGSGASFTPRPWPEALLAGIDVVASGGALVVDVRAAERYRGVVEPVDPRAGHIPGAVNLPWTELVDPGSGRFLPPAQLRERLERAGVRPGAEVVVHCGSGVTACHPLLAIERAGLGPARLFPGSFSQWSSDPARPVATGAGG